MKVLQESKQIKFHRIQLSKKQLQNVHMHILADAPKSGYGAMAYGSLTDVKAGCYSQSQI